MKTITIEAQATAAHGSEHAANPQKERGKQLPPWTVVPFVIILFAIAVLPLVIPHLRESNLVKTVISELPIMMMGAYLVSLGDLYGAPFFIGYMVYTTLVLVPVLALIAAIYI